MASSALVSTKNHVEAPFIIVKIGKYTLGNCTKAYSQKLQQHFVLSYPNYIDSLSIVKVNGAINSYTLNITYAITQNDDPNLLEKIFSSVSKTRTIYLSYGDWNQPLFIYKEEEAIITKLTTKVDMQNSKITYVVNCTGVGFPMTAGSFSFPARRAKPSSVIMDLLKNQNYGISSIFKGMSNIATVSSNNFIATDDQEVSIEAKSGISVLDYINYLVSCMVFKGDSTSGVKTNCYFWATYDDINNVYGGSYFKVTRVSANTNTKISYNTYEIDVGYPSGDFVSDFNVENDDSWSLLYDYATNVNLPQSTYKIDADGVVVEDPVNVVTLSRRTHKESAAARDWWSKVTQFPVTATLTIKGLLRPAMLMSYVKINSYFYGNKHISSGLYIVTKQTDTINSSGYRTTLTLTRLGGDEQFK